MPGDMGDGGGRMALSKDYRRHVTPDIGNTAKRQSHMHIVWKMTDFYDKEMITRGQVTWSAIAVVFVLFMYMVRSRSPRHLWLRTVSTTALNE